MKARILGNALMTLTIVIVALVIGLVNDTALVLANIETFAVLFVGVFLAGTTILTGYQAWSERRR